MKCRSSHRIINSVNLNIIKLTRRDWVISGSFTYAVLVLLLSSSLQADMGSADALEEIPGRTLSCRNMGILRVR